MRRLLSTFLFGGLIWVAVVFFDVPEKLSGSSCFDRGFGFSLVLAGLFEASLAIDAERRSNRWFNHPEADIEPGKIHRLKRPMASSERCAINWRYGQEEEHRAVLKAPSARKEYRFECRLQTRVSRA